MCRLDKNHEETFRICNKEATYAILITSAIISIVFLVLLVGLSTPSIRYDVEQNIFIRLFSVILAGLAVVSCILCYVNTKKDELFIISLMYMVFFIDILLGSFDNMRLVTTSIDIANYITVATSLIRISILLILILPFSKTREWIINHKFISAAMIILSSLIIGVLKLNGIIFHGIQTVEQFIIYNSFLILIYIIFTVRFVSKSIKEGDYIYAVLSASIFFFGIKALYAIVSIFAPSVNLKLVSSAITYIGFFIFTAGLLAELALSINLNRRLVNENKIFYTLVDDSKYSCIIIFDENGKVKYSNKTVKEYLFKDRNVSDEDVIKEIEKQNKMVEKEMHEEIERNLARYGEWKGNISFTNDSRTINAFFQKIYTYDGKENIAYIFRDITRRIIVEKNSIEYEKMKSRDSIKNEFFANISHELRTPLNIFYSTIQLLDLKSKDNSSDFVQVYSNHKQCLKTNCQRMLRLINNIVDITKIDVGFTKAKFVNCDIVRLVEDITLSVINYANPKDITITFDTDVEEHKIKCDPSMIERAMLNLLSNAIKFTKEEGNILVSMYADANWVHIRVKDDGIGIPLEMQSIIFERFVQSDKSLTRLNEGSGIGLSIVKSIIALNEGEIYLDSDGENGTEFEILLPNKVLEGYYYEEDHIYEVDMQKIQLELSDIYKLYE